MAYRSGREEVYEVAQRIVQQTLKSDGSLFTPGTAIWTADNVEDLYERFVGHPDKSSDSFEDKFRRQLEGAPLETRQLAAEPTLRPLGHSGEWRKKRRSLDAKDLRPPRRTIKDILQQPGKLSNAGKGLWTLLCRSFRSCRWIVDEPTDFLCRVTFW